MSSTSETKSNEQALGWAVDLFVSIMVAHIDVITVRKKDELNNKLNITQDEANTKEKR